MSSTDLKQTIARLRRLEAEATPGPWSIEEDWALILNDATETRIATFQPNTGRDAALIATMRNALPDLLDRLERLERVAEAVRDARRNANDPDPRVSGPFAKDVDERIVSKALAALEADDV
jgi:hypothetical protein